MKAPTLAANMRLHPGWSYLGVVEFIAIFALFASLPLYVSMFVFPALQPIHWLAVFLLLLLPAAMNFRLFRLPVPAPALAWAAGYAVLCLVWFGSFGGNAETVLLERLLALAVFVAIFALASRDADALTTARRAILAGVLVGIACNVYEALNPFSFVPLTSPYSIPGRAAGFHVNANASAAALLFGMIVTITLLPAHLRWLFVSATGVGVALTLSRAGILAFALALPLLRSVGVLRTADVVRVLMLSVVAAAAGWFVLLPALAEQFDVNIDLLVDRILWFANPKSGADFSQTERLQIAELGWLQFAERPLLGHGIGSTELWAARTSTHNVYLQLGSDFGIPGLLVLPALFLTLLAPRATDAGAVALVFVPLLAIWGLFSHNVFTDLSFVCLLAVAAANAAAGRRGVGKLPNSRGGTPASHIESTPS